MPRLTEKLYASSRRATSRAWIPGTWRWQFRRWVERSASQYRHLVPLALLLLSVGWLLTPGVIAWLMGRAGDTILAWSAAGGLRVRDVLVEGRSSVPAAVILDALAVKEGDPILAFDPQAARDRLASNAWVASVEVERHLPTVVYVRLRERQPITFWQNAGKILLVANDGIVLDPDSASIANWPGLPLVVGPDAGKAAGPLLMALSNHKELMSRISAASWIGQRRWDLRMNNGVVVRLPEQGIANALAQLTTAQEQGSLLDRDIVAVDLRQADRLVVQLSEEAIQRMKPSPFAKKG